ncbi:hypothetical protein BKP56_06685 [Marinilactibacillus sp. 15R]|uniref:GNAT family N-acetyltransferase n=1 Tax=Marinilactibacillus sp. 15R TaxID=1911586 RepID=UPI0009097295|nr:GNAT family N-acetyltransferase [Marinilactibacillus sp. 15R]API88980.1 hypothetical protein BKP56_06685 [Marinilactibacillus sp. 15R]
MSKQIVVNTAQIEEYQKVMEILTDTAKWLNEKGSTQWNDLLSGEDVHNTKKVIEKEEVYLVSQQDLIIGMFVLWENQSQWDQILWGTEPVNDICYLHRVALTKGAHGRKVGIQLINAALSTAKQNNKNKVRLDCLADNQYLNQLYKNAGFQLKAAGKTANEFNSNLYNLYEKSL